MAPRRHRSRRSLIIALTVALAVGTGLLVGEVILPVVQGRWWVDQYGLPRGTVSWDYVSGREESHLMYPDARVVYRFGSGEVRGATPEESSSAHVGELGQTTDPATSVFDWYHTQLLRRGYKPFELAATLSNWETAQGYVRSGGREHFVVAIDKRSTMSEVIGRTLPSGGIIVEFDYSISRPAG